MQNDFLGREIKAGDRVAYPVRRGSKMEMKIMTVHAVTMDGLNGVNPSGRRTSLKNVQNCVIVPSAEEINNANA